jgi:hypothetical protein
MESKKQSKAEKLLELLKAGGVDGVLNHDIATNPEIGWAFSMVVKQLRKAGHTIESRCIKKSNPRTYRTVLVQAAPEPEMPPILALMAAAEAKTTVLDSERRKESYVVV